MWSPIKPCLHAASEPRPPLQACGYPESMRGVWRHHDRRRRGPRELTGITDHSREGSSHGPLEWTWCRAGLAPCTRTGWPSAEKTCVRGFESRTLDPFQGQQREHHRLGQLHGHNQRARRLSHRHTRRGRPRWGDRSRRARHDRSPRTQGVIPSTTSGFSCAPHTRKLTPRQQERLVRPSRR